MESNEQIWKLIFFHPGAQIFLKINTMTSAQI